uniref:Uncharacterized protein n=1 Tax=Echinococcus canadensis TaxID=519352 RepID=A0A915EX75_9CEST
MLEGHDLVKLAASLKLSVKNDGRRVISNTLFTSSRHPSMPNFLLQHDLLQLTTCFVWLRNRIFPRSIFFTVHAYTDALLHAFLRFSLIMEKSGCFSHPISFKTFLFKEMQFMMPTNPKMLVYTRIHADVVEVPRLPLMESLENLSYFGTRKIYPNKSNSITSVGFKLMCFFIKRLLLGQGIHTSKCVTCLKKVGGLLPVFLRMGHQLELQGSDVSREKSQIVRYCTLGGRRIKCSRSLKRIENSSRKEEILDDVLLDNMENLKK